MTLFVRRLVVLSLCAAVAPLCAAQQEEAPSLGRVVLYGGLGGGLGFVFGTLIGMAGVKDDGSDDFGPAIYGAVAGEAFGLAFGSWNGNARRGSLLVDVIASAGMLVLGIAAADQSNPSKFDVAMFLSAQLAVVVATERVNGKWRSPSLGAVRFPDGGCGLALRLAR